MLKQSENRYNCTGNIFLIFLFVLFSLAVNANSDKPLHKDYQIEFTSQLHTNTAAINDCQKIVSQEKLFPFIDKMNFKLFSRELKIHTYNRLINQKINFLRKSELSIKPIVQQKLFLKYLNKDTDLLPSLN